jgi:hypothetical protein
MEVGQGPIGAVAPNEKKRWHTKVHYIFWDVTLWVPSENGSFGGTYRLHLQG